MEQVESAKVEVLHYFNKYYKPTSLANNDCRINLVDSTSPQYADVDSIYKKRKLTSLGGQCEVILNLTFRLQATVPCHLLIKILIFSNGGKIIQSYFLIFQKWRENF
jgi:hypothetical protein